MDDRARDAARRMGRFGWPLWLLLGACARPPASAPATSEASPTARPQTTADPGSPGSAAHLDESSRWVGVIRPGSAIDVPAPRAGQLERVDVQPGQRVEAGQVLAVLRDPEAEDERAALGASMRSDRAAVKQARVERDAAEHSLSIAQSLLDRGAGPRADVDAARLDLRRAEASLARTEATLAERRVRREQLDRHLAELEVRAPHAGRVARRYRDPGSRVTRDAPLVRLIEADGHDVRFAVPVGTPMPTVGTRVRVALSRGPTLHATVRTIAPEIDAVTGMLVADAELETDRALDPGASAWVSVESELKRGSDDDL